MHDAWAMSLAAVGFERIQIPRSRDRGQHPWRVEGDKMSGKGIGLIALAAALIPFTQMAAAQNYKGTPKQSIQQYGPFPTTTVTTTKAKATPPSGECGNPVAACLFYGGDFLDN